jgi:hypothetical protein
VYNWESRANIVFLLYRGGGSSPPGSAGGTKTLGAGTSTASALDSSSCESLDASDLPHKATSNLTHVRIPYLLYQYLFYINDVEIKLYCLVTGRPKCWISYTRD